MVARNVPSDAPQGWYGGTKRPHAAKRYAGAGTRIPQPAKRISREVGSPATEQWRGGSPRMIPAPAAITRHRRREGKCAGYGGGRCWWARGRDRAKRRMRRKAGGESPPTARRGGTPIARRLCRSTPNAAKRVNLHYVRRADGAREARARRRG